MKIEKNIVTLCILATIIGAGTIIPIAYLTAEKESDQTKPWFNVDIFYANAIPNRYGFDGITVSVYPICTATQAAGNFDGADARIEIYNFHIYSDQTSIANITYSITVARDITDSDAPRGVKPAIIEWGGEHWVFADGTKIDIKEIVGYTEGSGAHGVNLEFNPLKETTYIGQSHAFLYEGDDERSAQALSRLRNAQTVYIDVTRVMTVTYYHQVNPDSTISSTKTTLTSKEALSHKELTKIDDEFASGPVPDFIQNHGVDGKYTFFPITIPSASTTPQPTVQTETIDVSSYWFSEPIS